MGKMKPLSTVSSNTLASPVSGKGCKRRKERKKGAYEKGYDAIVWNSRKDEKKRR